MLFCFVFYCFSSHGIIIVCNCMLYRIALCGIIFCSVLYFFAWHCMLQLLYGIACCIVSPCMALCFVLYCN